MIQPGQTLWRIARVYGVSLEEIQRVNGIEDPTELEVGRSVFIPGAQQLMEVPPYPDPLPQVAGTDVNSVKRTKAGHPKKGKRNAAFTWPIPGGEILSYFGASRHGHRHKGIDIRGRGGQKVLAVAAGEVVYSGSKMRGYGKTVILDHGRGLQSLYAHNSQLLVRVGERVERGEPIARIGRTGNATTEHCHFEVRRNNVPVDPLPYIAEARP